MSLSSFDNTPPRGICFRNFAACCLRICVVLSCVTVGLARPMGLLNAFHMLANPDLTRHAQILMNPCLFDTHIPHMLIRRGTLLSQDNIAEDNVQLQMSMDDLHCDYEALHGSQGAEVVWVRLTDLQSKINANAVPLPLCLWHLYTYAFSSTRLCGEGSMQLLQTCTCCTHYPSNVAKCQFFLNSFEEHLVNTHTSGLGR